MLNFVSGSRHLGAYLCLKEELVAWVKPQVESRAHGVIVLGKISRQYPQLDNAGLGISLQTKWQYMQSTVPIVCTLMGTIEEVLIEELFPALFGRGGGSTPTFVKS